MPLVPGKARRLRRAAVPAVFAAMLLGLASCSSSEPSSTSEPTPSVTGWDEQDTPTPAPTTASPTPNSPSPTPSPSSTPPSTPSTSSTPDAPCIIGDPIRNGRLVAASLSVVAPAGWHYDVWRNFDWLDCPAILDVNIVDSWYADLQLGGATTSRSNLQFQAEDVTAVATQDLFPRGVVDVRQVFSRSLKVDGHQAWWVRREIRVKLDNPTVTGDRMDIVMVEVGSGRRSIFVGVAPLWDKAVQGTVDQARASLQVD